MKKICLLIAALTLIMPAIAHADLEQAAKAYCQYGMNNKGKKAAQSLAMCARILDAVRDYLSGQAEKDCYWKKSSSPECMKKWVNKYNAEFGKGSFIYDHNLVSILYTGLHYKMLLKKFPRSEYTSEAEFAILLDSIKGHPDTVLPKIQEFLKKHKKGEWHRKGLLLWARVNEDIWYIHKKWSWILYNQKLDEAELIVRSEPYRQTALKAYRELMKDKKTFEGKVAAVEYARLKKQEDDGVLYSITNDSYAGPLSKWGISQPSSGSKSSAGNGKK